MWEVVLGLVGKGLGALAAGFKSPVSSGSTYAASVANFYAARAGLVEREEGGRLGDGEAFGALSGLAALCEARELWSDSAPPNFSILVQRSAG